jgi:hypothetical protein
MIRRDDKNDPGDGSGRRKTIQSVEDERAPGDWEVGFGDGAADPASFTGSHNDSGRLHTESAEKKEPRERLSAHW